MKTAIVELTPEIETVFTAVAKIADDREQYKQWWLEERDENRKLAARIRELEGASTPPALTVVPTGAA